MTYQLFSLEMKCHESWDLVTLKCHGSWVLFCSLGTTLVTRQCSGLSRTNTSNGSSFLPACTCTYIVGLLSHTWYLVPGTWYRGHVTLGHSIGTAGDGHNIKTVLQVCHIKRLLGTYRQEITLVEQPRDREKSTAKMGDGRKYFPGLWSLKTVSYTHLTLPTIYSV